MSFPGKSLPALLCIHAQTGLGDNSLHHPPARISSEHEKQPLHPSDLALNLFPFKLLFKGRGSKSREGKFDFFNVRGSRRLITLARARQGARGILLEAAVPAKLSLAGWGCKALLVYDSRPPLEMLLPIPSDCNAVH